MIIRSEKERMLTALTRIALYIFHKNWMLNSVLFLRSYFSQQNTAHLYMKNRPVVNHFSRVTVLTQYVCVLRIITLCDIVGYVLVNWISQLVDIQSSWGVHLINLKSPNHKAGLNDGAAIAFEVSYEGIGLVVREELVTWKRFQHYWPFARVLCQSLVVFP